MTATPPDDHGQQHDPDRGGQGRPAWEQQYGGPEQGQQHGGPTWGQQPGGPDQARQPGGPTWGQGQQEHRSAYGFREDTSGPSYGPGGHPSGWTGPAGYVPPQPMRPEDQRLWATLVHVGGIFFPIVVPIVGYFVLRDRGQFLRDHTRTALNFHITMLIASAVGGITVWIGIGLLILGAVWIVTLVFAIMAALAANQGRHYAYPLSIEFVKD